MGCSYIQEGWDANGEGWVEDGAVVKKEAGRGWIGGGLGLFVGAVWSRLYI